MPKTKDYSMREMVLDRCFSTGGAYTREELMAEINRELEQRGMMPIQSRKHLFSSYNEEPVRPKCGGMTETWDFKCPEYEANMLFECNYISD
jgi:hypothetical protein